MVINDMQHTVTDYCNVDHYMYGVRPERRKIYGEEKYDQQCDHPLVGRHLVKLETGEVYRVESAQRHWWWGWYTQLLIERNNSHGVIVWENHSCGGSIAEQADKNQKRFALVLK
jgi:hypothetical protein